MPELPNFQQSNEQILNDIQSLQQIEQQLFSSLENDPNLTTAQQQSIIEKINQLSDMRINLYQTLSGVNGFYMNALGSSIGTLEEQSSAISIVENELNQSKERLKLLETEKNNKIRLVEINDYYSDKYAEHSQLMKIIIYTLIPVIFLTILNNYSILPNNIYYVLLTIVVIIGAIFFWKRYASIITRDNMNYQEYDFPFDPTQAPTGSSNSTDPWVTGSNPFDFGTCIGKNCCSAGQTYDSSINQCVGDSTVVVPTTMATSSTSSSTTESFINNVLTKTNTNYKSDYMMNSNVAVKPHTSESFINF